MTANHRPATRSHQQGIALLEVLIAFFVLSIGLLGLAGLQIKAVQYNQASFQQSQATVAAYDIMDRMRLNRTETGTGGKYNTGGWTNARSTGQLADNDLNAWLKTIKDSLPDGQGSVVCDANNICTVSIRWRNKFEDAADPNDDYDVVALSSQM